MKKFFLLAVVLSMFPACAGVMDKTHTLKHADGRTTECVMPGAGGISLIAADAIGKAAYGKEFDECMNKAKAQGFVEVTK